MSVSSTNHPPLNLDEYVPYQFAILSSRLSKALVNSYKHKYDLSRSEWRVMVLLAEMPGCASAALVARSGMDAVAVHRAVLKLAACGYVSRESSAQDKRLKQLRLTPEGLSVYNDIVPLAKRLEHQLFEALSPAQIRNLKRTLERLMASTADVSSLKPES